MPKTVNLKQKPYQLNDQQLAWVEKTLSQLSDEEKSDNSLLTSFSLVKMLLAAIN